MATTIRMLIGILVLGLLVTALNIYWVIDIGRRLDRTLAGIQKVGGEGKVATDGFSEANKITHDESRIPQ